MSETRLEDGRVYSKWYSDAHTGGYKFRLDMNTNVSVSVTQGLKL